ncbi:uncharacterized protein E5676_scaffold130G002100 [Cucumis melo var. makuwa]|uniref:Uncharacterized protein n=1 Tax=Cucumis melo var. makuwa TaxID=1194695 RepID=A0A5D3D2P8_CUCMM|nr:uncharacterized protein E5676_scaffold130G002100 [Cucumis melo var. makuwa]
MKIDLPSYDGKRKIQILSGLVKEYQELLQLYEYTRKKEGLLSSTKAKGWHASMIGTSRGEGEEMGGRAMADYIEELHRLGACTNMVENEQHFIARFVGGLPFDIKEKVKLHPFLMLFEAITYADSVEESIETNSKKTTRKNPWDSLNSRSVAANRHLSDSCPQRRTVAFLNEGEESNNHQEDVLKQEEFLEPDDGERLSCVHDGERLSGVLQRVLIAPRGDTSAYSKPEALFRKKSVM